jgi:tetratricopeptide (TPR) repeat protein
MRLLHLDDSQNLTLTDFSGRTIPPYAILSHRWGEDEVLYEDVVNNSWNKKDGSDKINFCGEQAAKDHLDYFWIDTCCIDKWNLRELSKAINSMFRWYQNAAKCYVFLSDVSAPTVTDALQQSTWEASFRASKWFTRGWTLQELIAPVLVEFFSSERQRLGDKGSLEQLIHDSTGIPVKALQNHPLDGFTVLERMEWAKNRETTEKEDSAYCLLGILNVLMAPSYGEGKERALIRLQKELETINTTPFIVPFSQNDQFIGQELQLAELEELLFTSTQTTKIAITGLGGMGKSQLALELAYRTRLKYKNCSVFWIPANDLDSFHQACAHIAEKLKIPGWDNEKQDVKKLVQLFLSTESAGQWLVIYDNADHARLASAGLSTLQDASLVDYIPQSELGTVIVTTTNSDTVEALSLQNIFEMPSMTPAAAQKLLENYLRNPALTSERQELTLLLEKLSYLPLAIVQAAAYISINKKTIKDYLSLFAELEKGSKHSSDESLQNQNNPIAATWLISATQIRQDNPLAVDYLFIMACMNSRDIPEDLLPKSSSLERKSAIEILAAYALTTKRPAESALDLHRLVQVAIRQWLQGEGTLDQITQFVITHLLQVFPDHTHGSRSKWRRYLPHVKRALSSSFTGQDDRIRTNLIWKCAMTLYTDGRYNEAEVYVQDAVKNWTRLLGEEDPSTLASRSSLAATYCNQGRWKEAEVLEVQLIEIKKRVLGEKHAHTLDSMANLASIYRIQGRWKDAEKLDGQVISLRKRVLGEEHPSTLNSMSSLASIYSNQGRWKEAEAEDTFVMEVRKRVLGEEHPDTLSSIANLAQIYRNQGRWKEAEKLGMRVLETSLRAMGEEHPFTMGGMADLASTYGKQGRWKEAEDLEVRVLGIAQRVLGKEHPTTLTHMVNLASTYRDLGQWKKAEELEVRVMEISESVRGTEHPDTLSSIANLAATYWKQGQWKEAEKLFKQVTELERKTLGDEQPSTLTSISNLALAYLKQGRLREAEELFIQVLQKRERLLGNEHPATLTSINNLASAYSGQGRHKEAEELQLRALEIRRRILGAEHPDSLTIMANLSCTFSNQGMWEKAQELDVQIVEVRKRVLGEEHPDTVASIGRLAATYGNQGQWTKAEEMFVQVIANEQRLLGVKHPDVWISQSNLASVYLNQSRWEDAEKLWVRIVETRKEILGDEHPDTLTSMANLASSYRPQLQWKKAEYLDKGVWETRKRLLGKEHPDTLLIMNNLAVTLKGHGQEEEGIKLMQECVQLRTEVLGATHPSTLVSTKTLDGWKSKNLKSV